MSTSIVLIVTLLVFYLSIGIGTVLKFIDKASFSSVVYFILLLPAHTFLVTYLIIYSVVIEKEFKGKKLYGIGLCLKCMPITSGVIGSTFIQSEERKKHIIKKSRIECFEAFSDVIFAS